MKQRYVSIMGDSISTYSGYNPQGYSVFYDENNQKETDCGLFMIPGGLK